MFVENRIDKIVNLGQESIKCELYTFQEVTNILLNILDY